MKLPTYTMKKTICNKDFARRLYSCSWYGLYMNNRNKIKKAFIEPHSDSFLTLWTLSGWVNKAAPIPPCNQNQNKYMLGFKNQWIDRVYLILAKKKDPQLKKSTSLRGRYWKEYGKRRCMPSAWRKCTARRMGKATIMDKIVWENLTCYHTL